MPVITVERKVLAKNDEVAAANRELFGKRGLFTINMLSSPGSGKTTLIEKTLGLLNPELRVQVIEGDIQTDLDAQRVSALGVPVVQIVTNGACHLEAQLVQDSFRQLPDEPADLLIIENVGNLVCPSGYDLGEDLKVVVLSITEGADKPLKYPKMFRNATVLLINKSDLEPYVDCKVADVKANALSINPDLTVFAVSARSGAGLADWVKWLEGKAGRR
ncbi:MAG: hydrogenase nickel incorporation protein HypB [Bacteroidetes bacterium]|nr:hydrogenase nickel incorporation protein HypB [Bacteroidota bacterium]